MPGQISTSLFGSSSRLSAPGGKCCGQHRAALLDRGDEAVGAAAVLDPGDQRGDRVVPDLGLDLGVDAGVGDDLGIALGDRGENQHPGAALGLVQPVREELPHRQRMGAVVLGAPRHHTEAQRRQREHDGEHDEHDELER